MSQSGLACSSRTELNLRKLSLYQGHSRPILEIHVLLCEDTSVKAGQRGCQEMIDGERGREQNWRQAEEGGEYDRGAGHRCRSFRQTGQR